MMYGYHLPGDSLAAFLRLPIGLMSVDLSATEERVYMLLLNRSFLSARSPKWVDGDGRVFLQYPMAELAGTLHRSISCVKLALNRLEELDLVERRSQGTGKPNRIYVKFPSDTEAEEVPADSGTGCAADTMPDRAGDRGTGCVRDRKLTPNKKYRERRKETEEGSENTAPARSRESGFFLGLLGRRGRGEE